MAGRGQTGSEIAPKSAQAWHSPRRWMLRALGVAASAAAVGLCTTAWGLAALTAVALAMFGFAARYTETEAQRPGPDQRTWKILMLASVFGAVCASPGFALACVLFGGEAGKLVAALLLINAVLSIILNSVVHKNNRIAPALLPLAGLLLLPLFPVSESAAAPWMQVGAIYVAIGCLFATFFQTFIDQREAFTHLRDAMMEAQERRREAEERRVQADSAARGKADFMVMMSHELRTPLNAVIGYSEMLHEDLTAEGRVEVANDCKRINDAGHQLLDMVEQIFDLTEADESQLSLHAAKVNFADIALDAAKTASAQAHVNANTFSVDIEDGVGEGVSDAGKIRQCLAHLLSNACKFTSSGAITLEVRRCADGRTIEFAVSDTGVGIAPEKIPELFTPFHQGETGFSRSFGGAGLGLAHARRLAQAVGGDIIVESALGIGSAFALRVPAHAPNAQPAAA